MSMSGISAIPLIQGSLDVSNMKNRLGLYGKLRVNNCIYYLFIQISVFEEVKLINHQGSRWRDKQSYCFVISRFGTLSEAN